MFESYTERARRVVFFARYEASNWGSRVITCEHLLLGLLRESPEVFQALDLQPKDLRSRLTASWQSPAEKTPTSIELPVGDMAKKVLATASRERGKMPFIDSHHLLLAILSHTDSEAAGVFLERGLTASQARDRLQHFDRRMVEEKPPSPRIDSVGRPLSSRGAEASLPVRENLGNSQKALGRATLALWLSIAALTIAVSILMTLVFGGSRS